MPLITTVMKQMTWIVFGYEMEKICFLFKADLEQVSLFKAVIQLSMFVKSMLCCFLFLNAVRRWHFQQVLSVPQHQLEAPKQISVMHTYYIIHTRNTL